MLGFKVKLVRKIFAEKNNGQATPISGIDNRFMLILISILITTKIINNNKNNKTITEFPSLKSGVKPLTSTIANGYFHYTLPTSLISEKDTREITQHLNEFIYDYFEDTFEWVDS